MVFGIWPCKSSTSINPPLIQYHDINQAIHKNGHISHSCYKAGGRARLKITSIQPQGLELFQQGLEQQLINHCHILEPIMKFPHISTLILSFAASGAFSVPVTSPDSPDQLPATSDNEPITLDCVRRIPPPIGYSVSVKEGYTLVEQARFAAEFASQCYRDPEHRAYNICFSTSHGHLGYMGDSNQVDLKTILKGALLIWGLCAGHNGNNDFRTGGTVIVKAGNGKLEKIFLRSPLPWNH
ncbi:hypothetical protein BGX38DRAFT_1207027 [Terfezia claveryi]|nr:hypothetical protein BGX38DRAFT_1207027 [Terfezia claveryi]